MTAPQEEDVYWNWLTHLSVRAPQFPWAIFHDGDPEDHIIRGEN
jgi:hypothetical protein